MILLEDTRQQAKKHDIKHQWFEKNGITIRRQALYVGDYTLPTNQSVCVDSKFSIQELVGDICGKQHERFRNELLRALDAGIKIIVLCEHGSDITCLEDVYFWDNPRIKQSPKATTGQALYATLCTIRDKYNVQFEFCDKKDTGRRIMEILGDGKTEK